MAFTNFVENTLILFIICTCVVPSPNVRDYINLGYAKHTVTSTNATGRGHKIDIYKNIRFAKPLTGEQRFKSPQSPEYQPGIQNGTISHESTCISSVPSYAPFPPLNGTHFGSEDCLFLDVYVPHGIKPSDSVPVLHWLYGSAYAFGGKDFFSNPMGLFDELLSKDQPFIFVTSNYRMGLYGWASSPYQAMDSNTGLEDVRIALEWTQAHIRKFGGHPRNVTAMGQSAGAGIVELIIAESRYKKLPFQKAFLSSSDLPLKRNVTERREQVYQTMLNLTDCTTLECVKSPSESKLSDVNDIMISELPNYGGGGDFGPGIGFGPIVDGKTVHDLVPVLLSEQNHGTGLKGLIVGNMQNEVNRSFPPIDVVLTATTGLHALLRHQYAPGLPLPRPPHPAFRFQCHHRYDSVALQLSARLT